jgi:GNAT superfamily N-acetyltransferase
MCEVIPAVPSDERTLSLVIADAFHDLPPAGWLIGDEPTRRRLFPDYFRILVDHAMTAGTVDTIVERCAVALWLPIGADGAGPPAPGYAARLAHATGPYLDRFTDFDTTLDQHHPTGTAHEHLAILAVHPAVQGQGIGTALLAAHHAVLDQQGTPAYLEASAPRNVALYLRHGYQPQPGTPFRLPSDGPTMLAMWRPAPAPRPG